MKFRITSANAARYFQGLTSKGWATLTNMRLIEQPSNSTVQMPIPTHTQSQTSAYSMVELDPLFRHARMLNAQLKRVNFRDISAGTNSAREATCMNLLAFTQVI